MMGYVVRDASCKVSQFSSTNCLLLVASLHRACSHLYIMHTHCRRPLTELSGVERSLEAGGSGNRVGKDPGCRG